jgi:hypothetical protein
MSEHLRAGTVWVNTYRACSALEGSLVAIDGISKAAWVAFPFVTPAVTLSQQ